MPWEEASGGGFRRKDAAPGKGGFVRNTRQYEKLRSKGMSKQQAAAIANSNKVEKFVGDYSPNKIRRKKNVQEGLATAGGATAFTGLATLGAGLALKGKGKYTGAIARRAQRFPGKFTHVKDPHKTGGKLVTAGYGIGTVGGGIGGASQLNSASILRAEKKQEAAGGPAAVPATAKHKEPAVKSLFPDLPTFGEIGKCLTTEEINKLGDWKSIDQRERSQARSRKTMRVAGTAAGLGAAAVGVGAARGGNLRGAKTILTAPKRGYKFARGLGLDKTTSVDQGIKNAAGAAKTAHGSATMLGGAGAVVSATAVGAGAKGHHTYQQHKINQRRRSNYKQKSEITAKSYEPVLKELFDSESKRMKRAEGYKTGTDITTGGLGVGAGVAAASARKQGFLKKVDLERVKQTGISAQARVAQQKTGKKQKIAGKTKTDIPRASKAHVPHKTLSLKGGKQAAIAGGLAAGAVGTHMTGQAIKRKSKGKSWAPY